MRKVIQHESKTYLAPMPVVEKPAIPEYQQLGSLEFIQSKEKYYNQSKAYIDWLSSWIECTGFEIGQEVEEGEWEMRARVCGVHCFPVDTDQVCNGYCMNKALFPPKVAIPKQQPERRDGYDYFKETFLAYVDRLLRDKGVSSKEVFDCLELALEDLKTDFSITPLTTRTKE